MSKLLSFKPFYSALVPQGFYLGILPKSPHPRASKTQCYPQHTSSHNFWVALILTKPKYSNWLAKLFNVIWTKEIMGIFPTQVIDYIFREGFDPLTHRSDYSGGNSFSVKIICFDFSYVCSMSFPYQFCLPLRQAQYRKLLIYCGL